MKFPTGGHSPRAPFGSVPQGSADTGGIPEHFVFTVKTLERLGISDRRDHLPSQLSGGEQQIVSLARALVKDPLVILADEPTGNLDPAASLKVIKLLEEINRDGTAVLMATHNFSLVKDRGYRFMQIVDGEVQT